MSRCFNIYFATFYEKAYKASAFMYIIYIYIYIYMYIYIYKLT